jgi:hypothetical protein
MANKKLSEKTFKILETEGTILLHLKIQEVKDFRVQF